MFRNDIFNIKVKKDLALNDLAMNSSSKRYILSLTGRGNYSWLFGLFIYTKKHENFSNLLINKTIAFTYKDNTT